MLTVLKIEKAIRAGKNVAWSDPAPRGAGRLVFRLRGGAAVWLFKYFFAGKKRLLRIGSYESMSLADARAACEPFRAFLDAGLDPTAEVERERREKAEQARRRAALGSVAQLFELYVQDMQARGKSSWPEVERALLTGKDPAADALGRETPAKDVSASMLRTVLAEVHKTSPSMAFHLRAYLHGAFQYGVVRANDYTTGQADLEFGLEHNPVAAIPVDKASRNTGQRALSIEELGQVLRELPAKTGVLTGSCFKLLAFIGGARPKEVLHARWEEFDLEGKCWNLPGARTKNGRDHVLPLSERALEVLRQLRVIRHSEFVFPNANDATKPMPVASLGQAAARFCAGDEETGPRMVRWSPRDLRRTVRTRLGDVGVSGHVLDVFLNHGLTNSVGGKHYDRSRHLGEKLRALAAWDTVLDKALGVAEGGKVINLAR